MTKQRLYECIEDLFRIYVEFIGEYYMMTNQYELAQGAFMRVLSLETSKTKLTELGRIFWQNKDSEHALQCFEDGIYRIFMDGKQLDRLDREITLGEDSELTFVRLTMLSGRLW